MSHPAAASACSIGLFRRCPRMPMSRRTGHFRNGPRRDRDRDSDRDSDRGRVRGGQGGGGSGIDHGGRLRKSPPRRRMAVLRKPSPQAFEGKRSFSRTPRHRLFCGQVVAVRASRHSAGRFGDSAHEPATLAIRPRPSRQGRARCRCRRSAGVSRVPSSSRCAHRALLVAARRPDHRVHGGADRRRAF